MHSWKLRCPIVRNLTQKREILEIEFLLALPNASGGWTRQLFLLDTGSQFTTVPIEFAESLGISLVESKPADPGHDGICERLHRAGPVFPSVFASMAVYGGLVL
jgi:hypothetical protein